MDEERSCVLTAVKDKIGYLPKDTAATGENGSSDRQIGRELPISPVIG